MTAVVLYGPPAAGKDTITARLTAADGRFRLLTKLKCGSGRTTGYRFIAADELDKLRAQRRIVVETHRYGNVYAVDRRDLDGMTTRGLVPVVHIGNVADLRKLTGRAPGAWVRVLLWTSREVCEERSRLRGDTDTAARLKAWDETESDLLRSGPDDLFDLVVRTDSMDADAAARTIAAAADTPRTTPCSAEDVRGHILRRG